MIGWINLSVESFICDSFGREAWLKIIKQAHVDCNWVSSCPYPDKVTYDIVITGAGILGVTVPQALEAYGLYFVNYVIKQGYTRLMKSLGSNIAEFLANLNNLHLHLTMGFPSMVAPAFRVEQVTSTSLLLHYHSTRPALWPIVSGVLKGASKVLFDHEVEMELVASREAGDCDHEIFKVTYPHQEALSHWDDQDAARASEYSMTKDFFFNMFPFHLILDKECRLVQAGHVMTRLYGKTLIRGSPIGETFKLRHPYIPFEYDRMVLESNSLYLLKALSNGLEFKGQMVQTTMPGGRPVLLFLGSPRVANLEEMDAHGLFLSDIPLHDMSRDFVLLAEQRQAEADLKERFEKLAVELRVANERLEQATRWLDEERLRSDALLYRMLPADIAADLREGRKVEAINYPEVTILFSDMVGFTTTSAKSTPEEVYNMLNEMYDKFDNLVDDFPDIYKLETIGDAYFLVCNLTTECHNHVDVVIDFAIRMQAMARHIKNAQGETVQIRVGIHTGPVVGGVLGAKTPRFSIYGDTVNVASRMESHGLPGKIHISDASYKRIVDKQKYAVRERGNIAVKGRGNMTTYLIGGTNDDWLLRHNSFDVQIDGVGARSDGSFVVTASGRSMDSMGNSRQLGSSMAAIKEGDEGRSPRDPPPAASSAMISGASNSSSQVAALLVANGSGGGQTGDMSIHGGGSSRITPILGNGPEPVRAQPTGPAGGFDGQPVAGASGGSVNLAATSATASGLPTGGSFRESFAGQPAPPSLLRENSLAREGSMVMRENSGIPVAREHSGASVHRDASFRAVYARGARQHGSPLVSSASRKAMSSGAPASVVTAQVAAGGGGGGADSETGSPAAMGSSPRISLEPSQVPRPEPSGGSGIGFGMPSGIVKARSATSKASPLAVSSQSALPPAAVATAGSAAPQSTDTAKAVARPPQLQAVSQADSAAYRASSGGSDAFTDARPSETGATAASGEVGAGTPTSKAKGLASKLKNLFKK